MNTENRKYPRKPFNDSLGIPVTIMQFGKLHRHDITVQGIDISDGGLGVVSDSPIFPGFVWFWRRVGSQKGGIVMWTKQVDGKYRAGIQFLQLPVNAGDLLNTSD